VSALVALAVGAIIWRGSAQVANMIAALDRLGPGTLSMALALSIVSALLSGVVWWRLLLRLGYRLPFRAALLAYLNAGMAGYVVNVAGPVLGCAVSLRRYGVGPARAVLLTLIANALGFCGILVWVPLGLLLPSGPGMAPTLPILGRPGPLTTSVLVTVMAVAMLVLLRLLTSAARSDSRIGRRLLQRVRTADGGAPVTVRYRHVLSLVPYSALSWVVGALALYVVLVPMQHGAGLTLGAVVGAAVLAAALGSLAFFAPEGVGVKDGALVALLTHATGLPVTTCVAGALAVRALDPVTKLSLLGILALTANTSVARLIPTTVRWLRSWRTPALRLGGLAVTGRRRTALLGAGMFGLVLLVSSHNGIAQADHSFLRLLPSS
jgi:uncharacterized membrane protein YbhN (UPF0104 family)